MENEHSDAEVAAAMAAAQKDIATATEFIEMMAGGLRKHDSFGTGDSREKKVATLCQMVDEVWGNGAMLVAAVALQLLAESDVELKVVETDWFQQATGEVEQVLRKHGVIK